MLLSNLLSCQSKVNQDSDSTIIEGYIQYPVSDKIYFYSYTDSISWFLEKKILVDSAVIDVNGNFYFTLQPDQSFVFDLENGKSPLVGNLFLCPGDKISIKFYGKSNIPEVDQSQQAGKFNSFLVKYLDLFYRNADTKQEYYISTNYMQGHQFVQYNKKREKEQLDFFNNYFIDDSLRKEYKDYALHTIRYGIAVDRLMYVVKKRMKSEPVVIDTTYFDFETIPFIENRDAFNCPAYIRFLNLYIKDTYERMVERGEIPADNSKQLMPHVEKYKLAIKLLARPYRDPVLYTIILNDMKEATQTNKNHDAAVVPLDSMISRFNNKYSLH